MVYQHLLLATLAALSLTAPAIAIPTLNVTACPQKAHIPSMGAMDHDNEAFPPTTVDLCYDDNSLRVTIIGLEERTFYYLPAQSQNGDIANYETMGAFVSRGSEDPNVYVDFKVNPGGVTYTAFDYNPEKQPDGDLALATMFITEPNTIGINSTTVMDRPGKKWSTTFTIPLALYDVEPGAGKGTTWRMNFFRTLTSLDLYPAQEKGAWSPNESLEFAVSTAFGHVNFV